MGGGLVNVESRIHMHVSLVDGSITEVGKPDPPTRLPPPPPNIKAKKIENHN